MGVSLAARRPAPRLADLLAFVLAVTGVLLAVWIIVASDGDSSQVVWPLVLAPVGIAILPVLRPSRGVRLSAVAALAAWCFLTGLTIGFLLLPTLGALVVALVQEES